MINSSSYKSAVQQLKHLYDSILAFTSGPYVMNLRRDRPDLNDQKADNIISSVQGAVRNFPINKAKRDLVQHLVSEEHFKKAVYNPRKLDCARHVARSAYYILSGKAHYLVLCNTDKSVLTKYNYECISVVADKVLFHRYYGSMRAQLVDTYLRPADDNYGNQVMIVYSLHKE